VKDLLKKKIAQESDGAIIVDLKQYDLDVMLILKSDGTSLYATKDLELAFRKFKEQKLDASTYVVDIRQSMYFRQLFKTLELYGFTKPLYHVAYDFVSTKEGPISSRKGNAYLYEDIRDAMVAKLKDETRKRHADWSDDVIMANARKLTFGALKFGMLKMERNRPIIFDEDEWLDFEGETGPYVQYSYARLNSILAKAGTLPNTANFGTLSTTVEKQLLSLLTQFPAIAEQAAAQYKPAVIARYVLDIAQKANEFYHSCPILSADEQAKNARLLLVQAIMQIMRNALFLLNIDVVQAM
jgi:arginyl-tRNA synthetase